MNVHTAGHNKCDSVLREKDRLESPHFAIAASRLVPGEIRLLLETDRTGERNERTETVDFKHLNFIS